MRKLILIALIIPSFGFAQPLKIKKNQSGIFGIGVRSTMSTFNGGDFGNNGYGVGGQYRLQISDRINSEWFLDYITANVGDFASRRDYHIGVSIMTYLRPEPNPLIKPYIVAGYCFDYTKLLSDSDPEINVDKLSAAIQAGGGMHVRLSDRMDLSIVSQYMIHLGEDIHAHRSDDGTINFEKEKGSGLEGHLLFHVGINYKLIDLWGREK